MRPWVATSGALALAACAMAACVMEEWEPDVGPLLAGTCKNDDSDPEADVSYSRDLLPLLNRPRGEAGCGCHTPTNGTPNGIALGGFDIGSYEALRRGGRTSGAAIVVPGDPCESILVEKIAGAPSSGARMPLDGPPFLTPEEVQLFHDWIAEGAEND